VYLPRALLWPSSLLLCAACSGESGTQIERDAPDGSARDAAVPEAGVATRCGETPVRLADYVPDVPEWGRSAVQIPTIAVSAAGLFYLSNWDVPVGSNHGRGGYVVHLPRAGGDPMRLADVAGGGSPGGQGLAVVGGTAIYGEARQEGPGAILSVSSSGGAAVTLTTTAGLARALVADDESVYFVDDEGTKSVPLTGGPARTLTSERPYSLLVAGSTLYLASLSEPGRLSSIPVGGGPVTVLADESALGPLLCGDGVCWMSGAALDASLKQRAPDGSSSVLSTGLRQPHDLVFDGRHFFVTTDAGGMNLRRIPAGGGTADIIHGGAGISSLALDDACLYWSQLSGIYTWSLTAATAATPDP
jgi:hypothetical protein